MTRVFLSNFDFEHCLAGVHRKNAAAISKELSFAWLSMAGNDDHIAGMRRVDGGFAKEFATLRGPLPGSLIEPGEVLVPWGWDSFAREFGRERNLAVIAPSEDAVRIVNSREFSSRLEHEFACSLPGATRVTSRDEFHEAIVGLASWVAKAEFSMSSRERLVGKGMANDAQFGWLENRFDEEQGVFVEPWVEVLEECGSQFEISESGDVSLVGTTGLLTTDKGSFAGCLLGKSGEPDWLDSSIVYAVATAAAEAGYFGPLGVDSALCVVDGAEFARPIQDVNGRYTMGRLALGWLDLLRESEQGVWLFVPSGEIDEVRKALDGFDGLRVTRTSPAMIGQRRANLSTWLLSSADILLLRTACHSVFSSVNRRLRW